MDRRLHQALAAFQAGDLPAARRICGEVLQRAPRNPAALHLLGVVCLKQGDIAAARDLLGHVVAAAPENAQAVADLGFAELTAGDFAGAERWLRRAMDLGRRDAATCSCLGIALASQGRHGEAIECFAAAVSAAPDDAGMHLNLGNAHKELGRPWEAARCYESALALDPAHPEALNNLGSVLQELGRLNEAVSRHTQALALRPAYAEAHNNLGNALLAQGKADDAIASFRCALALRPDYVDAHYNLGNALRVQRKFGEAASAYRRTLALDESHALAHHNLGNALLEQGEIEEAGSCFERAIALKPDEPRAHSNLGVVLQERGRFEDALRCYGRAITLDPDWAEPAYNLALAHLFCQDFEQAWPWYEARVRTESVRERMRKDEATVALVERLARWRGPVAEPAHEVAIFGEQGIGDQVLFSSLIPQLIDAGIRFVYEVDERLLGAYERAFRGYRFVPLRDPPHPALVQAARALWAGSLPGLFRARRADFSRQPARLLQALPERVAHYRNRIDALGPGLKLAFSWQSRREDRIGPRKSAPLAQFAPLLGLAGVQFVDVQYGDTAAERRAMESATGVRLAHFDELDYFHELEELLAIIEACDLLITTSNVNAHLAGALGKRTWLLYPYDRPPFHYWAHDGSYRCIWYPAVEIVSSPHLDWGLVIQNATAGLQRLLATRALRLYGSVEAR